MNPRQLREIGETLPEPARSRLIERADVVAYLSDRFPEAARLVARGAHLNASDRVTEQKRGGPDDR